MDWAAGTRKEGLGSGLCRVALLFPLTSVATCSLLLYLGGEAVSTHVIFKMSALSVALCAAIFLLHMLFDDIGFASLVAVLVVIGAGLLGVWVAGVLAVLSLVGLSRRSLFRMPQLPRLGLVGTVMLVGVAALMAMVCISAMTMVDCFADAKLLRGQIRLDTLFHVTLAEQLMDRHVASTALHGTPPIRYHILSHLFYGSAARLLQVSTLQAYGHLTFVVLIPLLFASVLGVAESIVASGRRDIFAVRALASVGLVAGFSFTGIGRRFACWDSYLRSESYLLALILFMGCLMSMCSSRSKYQLLKQLIFLASMCAAKVSVGAVAAAILVVAALRRSWGKDWKRMAMEIGVISFVGLGGLWVFGNSGAGPSVLGWFDFVHRWGGVDASSWRSFVTGLVMFFAAHFVYLWIGLGLGMLALSFRTASLREVDILWSLAIAGGLGIVAVSVLVIAGGAAYYFSNIHMFVAVPLLLSSIRAGSQEGATEIGRRTILEGACVALLGGVMVVGWVKNWQHSLSSMVRESVGDEVATAYSNYIRQLQAISADTSTRGYLVYVAKDKRSFWEGGPLSRQPFVITATSGRGALFGLPVVTGTVSDKLEYGYDGYSSNLFAACKREYIPSDELKHEANRLGYRGYIEVDETSHSKIDGATGD